MGLGTSEVIQQQNLGPKIGLWDLQKVVWNITRVKRFAGCHRWARPFAGDHVSVLWGRNRCAVDLQNSHSVWASPLSSAGICSRRAHELGIALEHWSKTPGHSVVFGTLTVRHHAGQSLETVWDAISTCWDRVVNTAAWRGGARSVGDRAEFGVEHYVRAVEVTWSPRHGWHVHTHVVMLLNKDISASDLRVLKKRLWGRWRDGAMSLGMRAPSFKYGIDLQKVDLGNCDERVRVSKYLTKGMLSGLHKEMSFGGLKKAKGENLTPFQILRVLAETGIEENTRSRLVSVWHEWEKFSHGRRQMLWSRSCKRDCGVYELTEEEIAAYERRMLTHVIGHIPLEEWNNLQSSVEFRKALLARVAVCKDAWTAAQELFWVMRDFGVDYEPDCVINPVGVEWVANGRERLEKRRIRRLREESAQNRPQRLLRASAPHYDQLEIAFA